MATLARRGDRIGAWRGGTVTDVMTSRQCTKPTCGRAAVATLTYVYADSTVVVGQLSTNAEPHCYDLCAFHAERFTAPRGWEVVHIQQEFMEPEPSSDDLDALARAVREAGKGALPVIAPDPADLAPRASEPRRGHLRVVGTDS